MSYFIPFISVINAVNFASLFTPGTVLQSVQTDRGLSYQSALAYTSGTTPPTITMAGNPATMVPIQVKCTGAGALGVWTGTYSFDEGTTTTAFTSAASVPLTGAGTGITLTIAAGNAATNNVWLAQANNWLDQSGNALHYTQGTANRSPIIGLGVNGKVCLRFDGVQSLFGCVTFDLPAPATTPLFIWSIYRVLTTPATNGCIISGISGIEELLYVPGTTNAVNQYDAFNANPLTAQNGSWYRDQASFTGSTSDSHALGPFSTTGQSAGNNDPAAGRYLGATGAAANFLNYELLAIVHLNAKPSVAQLAAADAAAISFYSKPSLVYGDPLSIFGATNVLQWVRADKGITVATGVSAWADQNTTANNYVQSTGAKQPTYTAADSSLNNLPTITFDGVSQTLIDAGLTLPSPGTTPTCALLVAKYVSYAGTNPALISDSSGTGAGCLISVGANTIRSQSGLSTGSVALAANTWARIRADMSNSAGDVLRAGSSQLTGNAGNTITAGRAIGSAGTGNYGNVAVFELVYLKVIPSAAQMAAYDAYVTQLTNGAAQV